MECGDEIGALLFHLLNQNYYVGSLDFSYLNYYFRCINFSLVVSSFGHHWWLNLFLLIPPWQKELGLEGHRDIYLFQ